MWLPIIIVVFLSDELCTIDIDSFACSIMSQPSEDEEEKVNRVVKVIAGALILFAVYKAYKAMYVIFVCGHHILMWPI